MRYLPNDAIKRIESLRLRFLPRHTYRGIVGFLVIAICLAHAIGFLPLGALDQLERSLYDLRLQTSIANVVDDRLVIIDIDEKSLQEKERGGEGRWPWPRDRLALLVEKILQEHQAAVLGIDVLLAEKDNTSGLPILEQLAKNELQANPSYLHVLEQLRPTLNFDAQLAKAFEHGPVVLSYAFYNAAADQARTAGQLPESIFKSNDVPAGTRAASFNSYVGTLPELLAGAVGAGHVNPIRDVDGVTRRVPMLVSYGGNYYESLSLAVVRQMLGVQKFSLRTQSYGPTDTRIEAIDLGAMEVPVDAQLSALIPFPHTQRSFRYLSASDVLNNQVPTGALKDRIVLIGTSAAGLADLHATPVSVSYPGVEIHANMIMGMLDDRIALAHPFGLGIEAITIVLAGLLMVGCAHFFKVTAQVASLFFVIGSLVGASSYLFYAHNTVIPVASAMACVGLIFIVNMAYGYFVESRALRQMTNVFGEYVPPEIVEKMAQSPRNYSMSPQRLEMTVLFSDIRNFTNISESLNPQDLAQYINVYLTEMSLIIREGYRGTLDKYIGDAIMAFWGAPLTDVKHAEDAVLASLDMQKKVQHLSAEFIAKGWPPLRIGIGVNTGPMRVGDMGSRVRKAYTVMGDAVNLGSRLEGITKQYGVGILVGEECQRLVSTVVFQEIDVVRVKGKDRAVKIFEPIAPLSDTLSAELQMELRTWDQALHAYRTRAWDEANRLLDTLVKRNPTKELYRIYQSRVNALLAQPPDERWDYVTVFNSK